VSKTYLKEAVTATQVAKDLAGVRETVAGVIADIRARGDAAVREYSAKSGNWSPADFRLSAAQVEDIVAGLPEQVTGTNHVLPTRGAARCAGGLWGGKYLKTVTYQQVRHPAASALLGEVCGRASRVELFEGHARSGGIRAAKVRGGRPGWLATALDGTAPDRAALDGTLPGSR
jgi:histidinol dehydrogenase